MSAPDLLERHRYTWATVPGIEPVDGWTLLVRDFQDDERFWYAEYIAVRGQFERSLHTSRFRFTPTQERFAFLIANPQRAFVGRSGVLGSWDDASIDAAIAAEAVLA
ncbi:hypothetical protein [Novosphingobium sp.]|uniref:hypothetical protein n=1 Tax=Novosphingobium sp. TaxID=1874826 RepID=UPI00286E3103|nr:hypothetical protein [Novosphingobium sp.]